MDHAWPARLDVVALLTAAEDAAPVDAVEVLAEELRATVGASEVSFLIVDFSGGAALRFARMAPGTSDRRREEDEAERVALAGTPYERALQSQRIQAVPHGSGARLVAPVTARGEAIGLLELILDEEPDDPTLDYVRIASHALAYVVIAAQRHTDRFERGQRNEPFSLPAEIQRRLLPTSFTCEAKQFVLAGWLEPASEIAGDTFDYAVDRETLHASITDAMGHGLAAALLATLTVGSLRNSRRRRLDPTDQAMEANRAVSDHASVEQFVTGLLLRVELATGVVTAVNAGHPEPLLQQGRRVEPITLEVDPPFGGLPGTAFRSQQFTLAPGDRLILLSDGMTERRASKLRLHRVLVDLADAHPREVVHSLGRSLVEVTGGRPQDDATVLCIDWYGDSGPQRNSSAGATRHVPQLHTGQDRTPSRRSAEPPGR